MEQRRPDGAAADDGPVPGAGSDPPSGGDPAAVPDPQGDTAARPWWLPAGGDGPGPGGPATSPPEGRASAAHPSADARAGGSGDAPPRRSRRWVLPVAVVLAVALLATVAVVTWLRWPPSTPDAVAEAAADVRTWDGVTYRARLTQPGAGPVDVELTSDAAGDVHGTLTRPGGGRAEYARVAGTEVLKGAPDWWRAEQDGAVKASRLAGYWVTPPAAVTSWLGPALPPSVTGLVGDLTGAGGAPPAYAEPGEREVDGATGRLVSWPDHEIVLSGGPDPRLVSVVPPGSPDPAGIRAARPAPGAVDAVRRGPDRVSDARDHDALLYAPGSVEPVTRRLPDCSTPQCPTPFELRNAGDFEARGIAVLVVNGAEASRTPFRLAAGARRGFELSFTNVAIAQGRDRVEVTYRIRVDPLP